MIDKRVKIRCKKVMKIFFKKFEKNLKKVLTKGGWGDIINLAFAGVAQLVEQLICNQQVGGSSPSTSSTFFIRENERINIDGSLPKWPKGTDCKSAAFCFCGSNPQTPTKYSGLFRCRVTKEALH